MTRRTSMTSARTTAAQSRTTTITLTLTALAVALAGGILAAGPLNPPAGAVASTYKTLTEVEPRIAINATNTPGAGTSIYKITQRGSYYLTGNLTGGAGRNGIEIAASGVTLDLMGFDLVGVAGSLDGVTVVGGGIQNVAVVNGSVRNWGGDGVDLATAIPINTRVADVHANANVGTGILTSSGSTVSGCSASFNTASGIHTGNGGAVANCSGTGNGVFGISTLGGCSVTNCSVYQNTGNGINVGVGCTVADCSSYDNSGDGINADDGSTVSGCTASQNGSSGIEGSISSTIINCSTHSNTFNGISASIGSKVSDCSSDNNGASGISTASGGSITNCSAYNNLTGISGAECVISHCTAYGSNSRGIVINVGTVANCTVSFSTLDGIWANGSCVVRDNAVYASGSGANDGASIHVVGADNRIEGNNCESADRGIDVDVAGNIIIGNTCTGHTTNWSIAANNYYGAIINRAGVATAAVSGDSAPTALVSTDPHANFTY